MTSWDQACGSSSSAGLERSLDNTMRAPSTATPDVIVLGAVTADRSVGVTDDPKQDLWLSTVDGRHQSSIIPVRVGCPASIFYIHRDILTQSEYFQRALNGEFKEAMDQAIELPEEDPSVFSFVVAWLYEQRFEPIKPISSVLVQEPDKGKRKASEMSSGSGSDNGGPTDSDSDISAMARIRNRRRLLERGSVEERQLKQLGRHRPDCNCESCHADLRGPPCWNCGVSRIPPPPPPPPPVPAGRRHENYNVRVITHMGTRIRTRGRTVPRVDPPQHVDHLPREHMSDEDLRVWLLAYGLSIDVYVCAERYLLEDFKKCITAWIIDRFEMAGTDAAHPEVLESCRKLFDGLNSNDSLLRMVFARVGFLLARLWKTHPEEISSFLAQNVEVATCIMRETMERRELDAKDNLPAMRPSASRSPSTNQPVVMYPAVPTLRRDEF